MNGEAKEIPLHPYLRKGLKLFKFKDPEKGEVYILKDTETEEVYTLSAWEFFLIESLPAYDNLDQFTEAVKDRIGEDISREKIENFLLKIAEKKLFSVLAFSHPIIKEILKKKEATVKVFKEDKESVEQKKVKSVTEEILESAKPLKEKFVGIRLIKFGPIIRVLNFIWPVVKLSGYFVPFLFISGLLLFSYHYDTLIMDRVRYGYSFFAKILFHMVTVNLTVITIQSLTAYNFGANIGYLYIRIYAGYFPRFYVEIKNTDKFSRRQKIWFHLTPLLVRLGLLGISLIFWFNVRNFSDFLGMSFLALATLSAISFLITISPLVKSDGYHLLCILLNEDNLREKALVALISLFKGNVYKETDTLAIKCYGIASFLYTGLLFLFMQYILYLNLKNITINSLTFSIILLILGFFGWRLIAGIKEINLRYQKKIQFEEWKKVTFPEPETIFSKKPRSWKFYFLRSFFIMLLPVLFIPYNYEVSGKFVIIPLKRQNIVAEVSGIIEEMNFNGGEFVKAGTVIGKLRNIDDEANFRIYQAKLNEEKHALQKMKTTPRPEEIELLKAQLKVQETRLRFSKSKAERIRKLYKDGVVSYEDFEEAEKRYRVDFEQVQERKAKLNLAEAGVHPEAIAAMEYKVKSLEETVNYYKDRREAAILRMPFDGVLVGMDLKHLVGSYIKKGEIICTAERTDQVIAQIDIPESQAGYVKEGAEVRLRFLAFPEQEFKGKVTNIFPQIVSDLNKRNFIKVEALVDNKDGLIKSGMTGYAKIVYGKMPLWKAYSLWLIRFFKVEVWSWIP